MAVRPVVSLPADVLRRRADDVVAFDEATAQLATDLVDTMRVSPGCVGLAAPQIGVGLRAFCVDVTGHKKANSCSGLVVMFNPVMLETEHHEVGREGCMSVPDLTGDVSRATRIVIAGYTASGEQLTVEADAFEARAFQHELDHIDGYLFLDRVSSPGGVFPRRVYR